MLLKAGVFSLALLLVSRLLGLVRESAQAAAFGASGLGDVAVLMLTLPDWLAGLLASGALAYVLLPHWAHQTPTEQAATQRRVARALLVAGVVLALLIILLQQPLAALLAAGLPGAMRDTAALGLSWAALAVPAALLGALWGTRLQHERDLPGMYAGNLLVNGGIILALLGVAWGSGVASGWAIAWLGVMLLVSMLARLAWLRWRLRRVSAVVRAVGEGAATLAALPGWRTWGWAILAAGLPLALPFVARSLASQSGEGALASFNYAWKLVELPLVLAIQLVASLAFPGISRAFAERCDPAAPVVSAFALAWTLACAAAAALQMGAPAIAQLLFGWGRMGPEAVMRIASWGSVGAWSLPPQALTAVGLTVLATQGRMHAAVAAYAAGLAALLLAGILGWRSGQQLMMVLNGVQVCVALVVLAAMRFRVPEARKWLPWQALSAPLVALVAVALTGHLFSGGRGLAMLPWAVLAAAWVMVLSWFANPSLRTALRR